MSRLRTLENRTALHIIFPSVFLMILGIGAVIGILLIASAREDRLALEESLRLVDNVFRGEQRALEKLAADYGWGVEAQENIVPIVVEGRSADRQLARYLAHRFGITGAFVLDAQNRALYSAMAGQENGEFNPFESFARSFDVMVDRAREQAKTRRSSQAGARGGEPRPVSSYLKLENEVFLAVATVVAPPEEDPQHPPTGAVLVLVRHFSRDYLREVGDSFGLYDLHFDTVHSDNEIATFALTAIDGTPLGLLAWQPHRAGRQLLEDTAGPVTAILLLMVGLGVLAVYRSHRAARALRRSAKRLARSEARFRTFAESASDWLWESGPDHIYTFFSERLGEILGGRPEAVLGGSLLRLKSDDVEASRPLRHAIEHHQPFRDIEHVVELEDGSRRILRISGQPVLDPDGQFHGYRGTGVDITEQVGAAREAARIRDLLYDAVESISEGFVLFGADGRLVVCNERYRCAYPLLADYLVPGVTFTEVLRIAARRGGFKEAMNDLASWVAQRLSRHLQHDEPTDHRLGDSRWYRISERATRSGGIVKILTDITELKRHEEALAGKTALLQATFDNIVQGISVSDGTDRLVAWNANFLRVLDYPWELGRTGEPMQAFRGLDARRGTVISDVFTGPTVPEEAEPERRVFEYVLPDGKVIEVRESPMPGGGTVATYTDITERKRFERVLADLSQTVSRSKGTRFFHALTASLSRALKVEYALIGVLDGPSTIRTIAVSADGRVLPNVEFDVSEAPHRNPYDGDICFHARGLPEVLPEGAPFVRWHAESYLGKMLVDSANQPIGIIAVMSRRPMERTTTARTLLDIFAVRAAAELERLQTEVALQESEYRYRQLVELAPYGIVIWDGTSILFANEAAARIFEATSAADMIGANLADRFAGHADEAMLHRLAAPLDGAWDGKPVEARVTSYDGEVHEVEVSIYLFAHEGRAVSLVMFNDITHRKRAETALQHAHKMQAVGELAGGIAHEFNNMLTAIGGFAHMARRSPDDGRRIEFCLNEIIKASDRAASLTAQLLTFSRRGITENIREFPVATLIEDLRGFLRPVLGETVNVKFNIRDRSLIITADPATLHQALVNLAINGRDAMAEGGTITFTVEPFTPDAAFRERHPDLTAHRFAAISVRDTGTGIEQAVIDRIFEPFFTTKDQGKGTGLGLPLVYSTVTRAGGTVEVTSEIGVGSTFILYIPAVDSASADETEEETNMGDGPMSATVLLVEDEEQVRDFIRMTLEDAGLTVVTAVDGDDAIRVFHGYDGRFDVVVSDLVMPNAGGVDVAKALEQEAPGLPIIFISGYAPQSVADSETLARTDGRAFLGKPLDPDRLVETVRSMLTA